MLDANRAYFIFFLRGCAGVDLTSTARCPAARNLLRKKGKPPKTCDVKRKSMLHNGLGFTAVVWTFGCLDYRDDRMALPVLTNLRNSCCAYSMRRNQSRTLSRKRTTSSSASGLQ